MNKKYTHLLWDFNGTIYNDVAASMRATNVLLRARGLKQIETIEHFREGFTFPVKDYYATLGFDYVKESYENIAQEWVGIYSKFSEASALNEGVKETITKLNNMGYNQSVISACEQKMLVEKLGLWEIKAFFDDVEGMDNVNAQSKKQIAINWRNQNIHAKAVMIGDTFHDWEVASLIGSDCILYTGGFSDRNRLECLGCPIIDSFDELVDFII